MDLFANVSSFCQKVEFEVPSGGDELKEKF